MDRSYARGLAAVAVAAATTAGGVSCSLLAPSDEELMGAGTDASATADATGDGVVRPDGDAGRVGSDGSLASKDSDASDASADSDAPGCTCAPAPPAGWTAVAFATANAVCPDGFGPPQAVEVPPADDGGGPCSCQCALEAGACDMGQVSVVFASNAACAGSSVDLSLSGSCASTPGGPSVPANEYVQVTAPGQVTACGATAIATLPTPASGTLCVIGDGGANDPGECPIGSMCAPSVPAPYAACIAKAGTEPCPSGWTHAYQVGTSFMDTRTCGDCACGPVPCTGTLRLWTNGGCAGTPDLTASIDGFCRPYGSSGFTARRYEAVITDGGCAVTTPSTLDGGLSPEDAQTVCCP